MGHFIGIGESQYFVDNDGTVWTNSSMTHKVDIISSGLSQIIDNEDEICNNTVAESFTDEQPPKKRGRRRKE